MRIGLHFGGSLALLLLATLPFWVTPLDLAIQGAAWQGGAGWSLGEKPLWKGLYHFGTIPALLVTLASLVALARGWRGGRPAPWSKAAAYLVLCMAVGPGILVNLVLKDHWGRPRPRDVRNFGGEYPAETVWVRDPSSPGKSFPCGHCTMGFYFFAPGILLWRLGRRRMSRGVFSLAWGLGILLGVARILQGGHFASDVLWGAGICWLVSLGLYYALGLDRRLEWTGSLPAGLRGGPWRVAGAVAALILVAGILLATPYRREERHELRGRPGSPLELSLVLEGTRHRIRLGSAPAQPGSIVARGQGHGLPGSAVKSHWTYRVEPEGTLYFQFKQRMSGWFSELDQRTEVVVPACPGEVRLRVCSGVADVDFQGLPGGQRWKLTLGPGAVCRWRDGSRHGELGPGESPEFTWPPSPSPASR